MKIEIETLLLDGHHFCRTRISIVHPNYKNSRSFELISSSANQYNRHWSIWVPNLKFERKTANVVIRTLSIKRWIPNSAKLRTIELPSIIINNRLHLSSCHLCVKLQFSFTWISESECWTILYRIGSTNMYDIFVDDGAYKMDHLIPKIFFYFHNTHRQIDDNGTEANQHRQK